VAGLIGIGIGMFIGIIVFAIWQFIEYIINRFIVGKYKYVADVGFVITLIVISIMIVLIYIA
jgi:hypothetical protein